MMTAPAAEIAQRVFVQPHALVESGDVGPGGRIRALRGTFVSAGVAPHLAKEEAS
jgi:hypothetical protein